MLFFLFKNAPLKQLDRLSTNSNISLIEFNDHYIG